MNFKFTHYHKQVVRRKIKQMFTEILDELEDMEYDDIVKLVETKKTYGYKLVLKKIDERVKYGIGMKSITMNNLNKGVENGL